MPDFQKLDTVCDKVSQQFEKAFLDLGEKVAQSLRAEFNQLGFTGQEPVLRSLIGKVVQNSVLAIVSGIVPELNKKPEDTEPEKEPALPDPDPDDFVDPDRGYVHTGEDPFGGWLPMDVMIKP